MDHEFTAEEIREAARAARIYCPNFNEETFESLMELEKRIDESGYLESVQSLARLEEEKGILCSQALEVCRDLLGQKTKLEELVPALEMRVQELKEQIGRAKEEYEQVNKAVEKAERELAEIRGSRAKAEKELDSFRKKAEAEKQRIDAEVQEYHKRANVKSDEVSAAGQIKAEVESHGLGLELVLNLSQELAIHKDAREKLAEGLKKHRSLIKYLDELAEWEKKRSTAVKSELASLESQKKELEGSRQYLETALSQLQSDIAAEEELRRFYQRYQGVSNLIEYLAGWNQIVFLRCNNPVFALTGALDRNAGNARFWTDKPPTMCPHCGYRQLLYDERAYQALNWPLGEPLRLRLGE